MLAQRAMQRICTAATKEAAFFAYRVAIYSGPPVKDQKGVKKSLGQGSRNEALFIHAARGYLSR